jgi:hypothetical protein
MILKKIFEVKTVICYVPNQIILQCNVMGLCFYQSRLRLA